MAITHFNQKYDYDLLNQQYGESIEKMYVNENKFIKQISEDTGLSLYTVKQILKLRDIELKTRSEIKKTLDDVSIYRKHFVNGNYFKKWSSNMAYTLGFIAADGCILKNKNTLRISLKANDKELLENFKNELEFSGEIYDETVKLNGKSYVTSTLSITSKEIADSLKDIGITERKSFTIKMTDKIPIEFIPDFIRGYFDGDGSVEIRYPNNGKGIITKSPQIRTRIFSGSSEILHQVRDFLGSKGLREVLVHKEKNREFYSITYSTFDSIKFYEIVYSHNPKLYLNRKKVIFEKGISLRNQ